MQQGGFSFRNMLGRVNFKIFFFLFRFLSPRFARYLLYIALQDNGIYGKVYKDTVLNIDLLNKTFPNPIGIASGFDTEFKYNDGLMTSGFGFEEFGTFTLSSSKEKTKIHIYPMKMKIILQQMSYPNKGLRFAQTRLAEHRHLSNITGVSIAVNSLIGSYNDTSIFTDIEQELREMIQGLAPYCDYVVINLSHPTLPCSALLDNPDILTKTLLSLKETLEKVAPISKTKLVVKVPMNMHSMKAQLVAEALLSSQIDAIIIGGYIKEKHKTYNDLLVAGLPLKEKTLNMLRSFYTLTNGQIPLIASGGVFSAEDAFEMIQNGASLIQLHSAILIKGPYIANTINTQLANILRKKGFTTLSQAVGSKVKLNTHNPTPKISLSTSSNFLPEDATAPSIDA